MKTKNKENTNPVTYKLTNATEANELVGSLAQILQDILEGEISHIEHPEQRTLIRGRVISFLFQAHFKPLMNYAEGQLIQLHEALVLSNNISPNVNEEEALLPIEELENKDVYKDFADKILEDSIPSVKEGGTEEVVEDSEETPELVNYFREALKEETEMVLPEIIEGSESNIEPKEDLDENDL